MKIAFSLTCSTDCLAARDGITVNPTSSICMSYIRDIDFLKFACFCTKGRGGHSKKKNNSCKFLRSTTTMAVKCLTPT